MSFGEYLTKQVEKDLKRYCIKHFGFWWSTTFFMGKKADDVYGTLRYLSVAIAIQVIANDDPNYKKYIDMHEDLMDAYNEMQKDKVKLKE